MSPTDLAHALEHARARTDALLEPLSDEQLTRQVSPLQSPLVWDLAHIGHFEELWLLRRVGKRDAVAREYDELYDSFSHARAERGSLPILAPRAARAYVTDVRKAVLAFLPELSEHDFLVGMVVQHELQHGETMAQTLALAGMNDHTTLHEVEASGEVHVPGGSFTLGSADPWAYDNERPAHEVELPPFWIDRALVTNAEYAAFMRGRGSGSAAVLGRRARAPARAGAARLVSRRRGVRALGGEAPADRGRVGEGGEDGRRRSSSTGAAPSGSGRRRSSTAIPASAPFRTRSTRRRSSATSTGCCAAARRSPIRSSHGRRSATGICRSGGRSSPASAARAMSSAATERHPALYEETLPTACAPSRKQLPTVWLYDERGSLLYEGITRLPEYYLPRREREILRARAAEIAERMRARTLVELGAGNAETTRLLLDALDAGRSSASSHSTSASALRASAQAIARRIPSRARRCDRRRLRARSRLASGAGPRLIAFLGSTIGNLYPEQRLAVPRDGRRRARGRRRVPRRPRPRQGRRAPRGGVQRQPRRDRDVRPQLAHRRQPRARRDVRSAALRLRRALGREHEWMDIGFRARKAHTVSIRRSSSSRIRGGRAAARRDQLQVPTRGGSSARPRDAGLQVESWWTDRRAISPSHFDERRTHD